jgi:hypothetical protein
MRWCGKSKAQNLRKSVLIKAGKIAVTNTDIAKPLSTDLRNYLSTSLGKTINAASLLFWRVQQKQIKRTRTPLARSHIDLTILLSTQIPLSLPRRVRNTL